MTITALTIFASSGEKNTTGLSLTDGFPAAQKPARQWFNWLFNTLTAKINEVIDVVNTPAPTIEPIKIGGLLLTTTAYADAAAVAAGEGYGTWARYAEGRAIVGLSDNVGDPAWTKTLGSTTGEYEHTLTVEEMAAHNHGQRTDSDGGADQPQVTNISGSIDGLRGQTDPATSGKTQLMTDFAGSNQPHNNTQPSITVGIWRRTA